MSKKTLKANSVNTTHGNVEFEQGGSDIPEIVEMIANDENNAKSGQIYLRDTLIQMDEFKKYGLNQYFLRAILKENYYTLDKAHKLVQDFLNNH
jgi:hypothetical protein